MNCPFIQTRGPRVAIVYIYPLNGNMGFAAKAQEFARSYQRHPPGMEHETIIICNGEPASDSSKALFDALPNKMFLDHDNSGWDLGGFQKAARTHSCDLMVFFSVHTYFRRANWLLRMYEAFDELGDTLYGATGHQGDLRFNVHPHVRTTGFWMSPGLFNEYPHDIKSVGGGGQRYEAEHGASCLSNWIKGRGRKPWIVGWDSIWPLDMCDSMPEGYHQGVQNNVLVGDRLTAPPFFHTP